MALLAILCRKRRLKKLRRRAAQDPFLDLDLDSEMVAVNQPLIVGDGPAPGGMAFADPFSDDSRPRTRSRSQSATTGPATSLARSSNSFQAVVGSTTTPDPGGGLAVDYHNQLHSTERRSPPPRIPPSGITRTRSPSIQTIPRQSSPSFDSGVVAYLRYNDQAADGRPPSPGQFLPGNVEDHRLISAFSASSGLNPRHSNPIPPLNTDETWRNSPDPMKASLSHGLPFDRRHSFTPSISGHISEPGDTVVIAPLDPLTQGPVQFPINTESDDWDPYNDRSIKFGSRPSPITEITELPSHSQEGSNNSGGTWNSRRSLESSSSSPVVMQAQRVRLTSTALSLVSQPTPSTASNNGESIPSSGSSKQLPQLPPLPVPVLPHVKPLSLGKKRPVQGIS